MEGISQHVKLIVIQWTR